MGDRERKACILEASAIDDGHDEDAEQGHHQGMAATADVMRCVARACLFGNAPPITFGLR